jgi:hypothetical protein
LRGRRRQGQRGLEKAAKEEENLRVLIEQGRGKIALKPNQQAAERTCALGQGNEKDKDEISSEVQEGASRAFTRVSSVSTVRAWEPNETGPAKELPAAAPTTPTFEIQDLICKCQANYTTQQVAGGKTVVKRMASEQAQPPVPYTRLKEITETVSIGRTIGEAPDPARSAQGVHADLNEQACEAALSGVESYVHTDTEKWNTTIINSILGALVQETAQPAAADPSAPAQPQFKYVVNSTIIQHAASSSSSAGDDSKKTTGRRGMHAASGAYWNNEKDGMWSFKYPGADSKGLDVVVGIIWVWVG